MNDLISRQEALIKSLESALLEHKDGSFILCSPEFVSVAVEILKELKTLQWIPCSERLPGKERKTYWVCTDTGYQCQCRWTNDVYGLGASDKWEWKIFDIPQYQKVTAWMPLPEPYKGDDA